MKYARLLLAYITPGLLASCTYSVTPIDAGGIPMLIGSTAYALTNLHSYQSIPRVYSTNFQQPGLIPRCSPLIIRGMNKQDLLFDWGNMRYTYRFSRFSTPEGFEANLKKYFGTSCDLAATDKLSAIDQKGISEGLPYIGMSKQGVIYAMGYPPQSATPSTELSRWKYWVDKDNTILIEFTGDLVNKIGE